MRKLTTAEVTEQRLSVEEREPLGRPKFNRASEVAVVVPLGVKGTRGVEPTTTPPSYQPVLGLDKRRACKAFPFRRGVIP